MLLVCQVLPLYLLLPFSTQICANIYDKITNFEMNELNKKPKNVNISRPGVTFLVSKNKIIYYR